MAQCNLLCQELTASGEATVSTSSDCLSMLKAKAKLAKGASSRQLVRRSCGGALQTVVDQEHDMGDTLQQSGWGGAEHSMNPRGDERLDVAACLNRACDEMAKRCAHADTSNELSYHAYWKPPPPAQTAPYYFASHGMAWSEDPYARAMALMGADSAISEDR